MRNPSVLHWTLLVALLASPGRASAQRTTYDQEPVASSPSPTITTALQAVAQKRAQTHQGDSEFRTLHNPVISADGAWMAAEERPDRGDGIVRVWSTEGDKTFTIERGQNPRISRDSCWVSALQKPPLEDSRTGTPKNDRAGQTLVLLDTRDGSQRMFDFVLSYEVTYFSSHLAYLQSPEAKADEEEPSKDNATKQAADSAVKERKGGKLHMVELVSDRVFMWQNVTQYAAHQTTDHGIREKWKEGYAYVAFVMHDEETGSDSLEVAFVGHAKVGWGTGGTYDGEKIEGLCWARDSVTLGFLDSTETTDKDGKPRVSSALYTWHDMRGRSGHREFTRVDRVDSEFRALYNPVISADGAWMAAEERPDRGDGIVRVWSTEGDKAFTIERGQNPRISRDSRWVSALQKPPLEDSRTARPKNKRAGQTLVLLDTQDGSRRTFDFVLSHDWTYSYDGTYTSMHLVYLQSPETKADEEGPSKDEATKPAKKPAAKERKVGTLHLVHLKGDGNDWVLQNVTEYATHQTTRRVAFVVHDCQVVRHAHEETGRDSLHISGFSARNTGNNAIYDGEKIEGLCWARDRLRVGFIDSTETTGKDGKRRVNSALYTWQWSPSLDTEQPLPIRWRRRFTRVDTPQ